MNWLQATSGALLIGSALAATGCGGYGSICEQAMDCEGGNDNDIEACEISWEANEDVASIYGCDVEFEEYFLCFEERADCDGANDSFGLEGAECDDEAIDLNDCVN